MLLQYYTTTPHIPIFIAYHQKSNQPFPIFRKKLCFVLLFGFGFGSRYDHYILLVILLINKTTSISSIHHTVIHHPSTMASITANTKHKVAVPIKKKLVPTKKAATSGGGAGRRGSTAPLLKPATLTSPEQIDELIQQQQQQRMLKVKDLCRLAMGGEQSLGVDKLSKPHTASTTKDRASAAADVAVAAKHLGIRFVLNDCGVMAEMSRMLFPEGISKTFAPTTEGDDDDEKDDDNHNQFQTTSRLKPSASAVSLTSLDTSTGGDNTTTASVASNDSMTMGTDSKRGKTTPASAREGSLLLIRAFCECLGRQSEPYMVGAFLMAALDECGSNSSSVREAAEDTTAALVKLANPWAFPRLIAPLILKALKSTEWYVRLFLFCFVCLLKKKKKNYTLCVCVCVCVYLRVPRI